MTNGAHSKIGLWARRLVVLLMWIAALLALSACVPIPYYTPYYRIDPRGSESHDYQRFPSSDLYFEHQSIFLSVSANVMPKRVIFRLHVPEGHRVELCEQYLALTYGDGIDPRAEQKRLSPLPWPETEKWEPLSFRVWPHPTGNGDDFFGVLQGQTDTLRSGFDGSTKSSGYMTYSFIADFDGNRGDAGLLTLPAMMIDGIAQPGPRLSFKRAKNWDVWLFPWPP